MRWYVHRRYDRPCGSGIVKTQCVCYDGNTVIGNDFGICGRVFVRAADCEIEFDFAAGWHVGKVGHTMYIKRNIYEKLVDWKHKNTGHVLELRGARQVGKTFILDKFAKENYEAYLYINMVQTSGKEFLACLDKATAWEPGLPRKDKPLHEAVKLFYGRFQDKKETVVVIDEIQESARVYSLNRQFARDFECHFIVTGSYLGKPFPKSIFSQSGIWIF